MKTFVSLLLLAIGAYGGYFGYCRYKVYEKQTQFHEATRELKQALVRLAIEPIGEEQVRTVVQEMAQRTGVELLDGTLKVESGSLELEKIEARGEQGGADHGLGTGLCRVKTAPDFFSKMNTVQEMALSTLIKTCQTPKQLLGFYVQAKAAMGPAHVVFSVERYTWID